MYVKGQRETGGMDSGWGHRTQSGRSQFEPRPQPQARFFLNASSLVPPSAQNKSSHMGMFLGNSQTKFFVWTLKAFSNPLSVAFALERRRMDLKAEENINCEKSYKFNFHIQNNFITRPK